MPIFQYQEMSNETLKESDLDSIVLFKRHNLNSTNEPLAIERVIVDNKQQNSSIEDYEIGYFSLKGANIGHKNKVEEVIRWTTYSILIDKDD